MPGPCCGALQVVFRQPRLGQHRGRQFLVFGAADVARAGQGDLRAAQGDPGLHGGQCLEGLERGAWIHRGVDIAQRMQDRPVGSENDGSTCVARLDEAAAVDDSQIGEVGVGLWHAPSVFAVPVIRFRHRRLPGPGRRAGNWYRRGRGVDPSWRTNRPR